MNIDFKHTRDAYAATAQAKFSPPILRAFSCAALQGRPSLDAHGCGAYRGAGGAKCPAGFLIPDASYTERMEFFLVNSKEFHDATGLNLTESECDQLGRLQDAHDRAARHENFVEAFIAFSKRLLPGIDAQAFGFGVRHLMDSAS